MLGCQIYLEYKNYLIVPEIITGTYITIEYCVFNLSEGLWNAPTIFNLSYLAKFRLPSKGSAFEDVVSQKIQKGCLRRYWEGVTEDVHVWPFLTI